MVVWSDLFHYRIYRDYFPFSGKSLTAYKGGVILVSHDERLLKYVCNEIWLCKDQTVKRIEGGFDEYKKMIEAEFQTTGSIAEEGKEH